MLSFKTNFKYYLKIAKNQVSVLMNEITQLIVMKMRMKMTNRSHKYDKNRTRPRHGYKYAKYKMYLSMLMVMCNKQHLSNI